MSETQLMDAVTGLCRWLRISYYHPYDSRRSPSGWPDLVLCGDRGVLLRELKTGRGRLTGKQLEWGRRLALAGMDWGVWRPDDLRSGRIRKELEAIR